MRRLLPPALAYASATFAAGFVLGALRVTLLVPRFGDLVAVAMELPVILALSWGFAGLVLRRWPVPPGVLRLGLGGLAFGLLMLAEAGLALAFGQSPAGFLRAMTAPAGALGLLGQVGFAILPWLRR